MTSEERPSVLERLKGYKAQLDQQQKSAPTRELKRSKKCGNFKLCLKLLANHEI